MEAISAASCRLGLDERLGLDGGKLAAAAATAADEAHEDRRQGDADGHGAKHRNVKLVGDQAAGGRGRGQDEGELAQLAQTDRGLQRSRRQPRDPGQAEDDADFGNDDEQPGSAPANRRR